MILELEWRQIFNKANISGAETMHVVHVFHDLSVPVLILIFLKRNFKTFQFFV